MTTDTPDEAAGGRLYDAVAAFLRAQGWSFEEHAAEGWMLFDIRGESGIWPVVIQAYEERHQVVVFSLAPFRVAEERRQEAMLLLTRANYGIIIGNFELDVTDGEVRFKTAIDVEGNGLTDALMTQLVAANIVGMDRYLPAIASVAEGATADEALERVGEGGVGEG